MTDKEKTLEQRKNEANERIKILREWGDARDEHEQIIYAQGLNGDLKVYAVLGSKIETVSLLYDLLERVATESEVDFISMVMGFLRIYHDKAVNEAKNSEQNENKKNTQND